MFLSFHEGVVLNSRANAAQAQLLLQSHLQAPLVQVFTWKKTVSSQLIETVCCPSENFLDRSWHPNKIAVCSFEIRSPGQACPSWAVAGKMTCFGKFYSLHVGELSASMQDATVNLNKFLIYAPCSF